MKTLEQRFNKVMMKHLQTDSAYTVTLSNGLYWELLKEVEKYYKETDKGHMFRVVALSKTRGDIVSKENEFLNNLKDK